MIVLLMLVVIIVIGSVSTCFLGLGGRSGTHVGIFYISGGS